MKFMASLAGRRAGGAQAATRMVVPEARKLAVREA
jgi:hypothetical protein